MSRSLPSFIGSIAFGLIVLLGQSVTSRAADLPPPVIAVVDIQMILQDSVASKSIQKQLDTQRQTYQNEISKQEEKLRAAEQELGRQRTILSQDAFAQKRREFEQQVAEVQRNVQARKKSLDQAFNESMTKVRDNLLQIVADVAGERKATLVLAKQQVVIVEKSLDLTSVVLERLNKKLPNVAVNISKQ
jgi:outer membrane protein